MSMSENSNGKERLAELREQINDIDARLLGLFEKRMEVCTEVAKLKLANGLQIFHPEREKQVIERVRNRVDDELKNSAEVLFTTLMDISKCDQCKLFYEGTMPFESVPLDLSVSVSAAVPGTFGSYSHAAAKKMLPNAEHEFFESFGEVFAAVESGRAEFGILPIVNSTAGTVTQTYELLNRYDMNICATTKIAANHCIACRSETAPADIRKVFSHEQALMQCSNYLSAKGLSARSYENTALAAAYVKESSEPYAAICSELCAESLGLKIIDRMIANAQTNYTRFILISKDRRRAEDANIISVSLTLPHQTSALYRMLTKFSVAGLNLTKLESRPIANTDFDVLFYLDFEGSIDSPDVVRLMRELKTELSYFKYLGNYNLIV